MKHGLGVQVGSKRWLVVVAGVVQVDVERWPRERYVWRFTYGVDVTYCGSLRGPFGSATSTAVASSTKAASFRRSHPDQGCRSAYFNICRHRASPVTGTPSGMSPASSFWL
ncbi:hypothetical protein GCM10010191_95570 [Actinomadura vinacea]|uniref:Uncharacterized protein n=1 Tax=Actinomadura vinacea TaxID=115336 RepID=A0ABN3KI29_9ACTN